ncbi:MAG: hypothetical protein HWD92_11945 [Flavobacteriia bacterium]|nr:hypothetical protein [Flavobacteriia bacterium]
MSLRFAQILSYILHPAIIPSLGAFLILNVIPEHITSEQIRYTTAFVFLSTYIVPAAFSLIMRQMGMIQSLHMSDAKDRRYPFMVSIVFFAFTGYTLYNNGVAMEIVAVLAASAVTLLIFLAFLSVTKLSVHLAGMGGLTATVLYLSYTYHLMLLETLALAVLLSGLLGTARLKLKAHTTFQILSGYGIGLACTFIAFHLLEFV